MSRLCFLFNHDHVHQVAHSLPIALSMAASGRHDVVVASGSPTMTAFLRKAMGESANIPIIELGLKRTTTRLAGALFEPFLPARKILLYRDNLDFFDGFDALVVSEKTSLILKTHYGLSALKIIHTRHGAGDRAIGFDPESRHFDLSLVAGPKIARRLVEQAGVAIEKIVVTGYPKFELHGENRVASPFPDPSRKTVLYAPHPSPRLSSWYKCGQAVLEAFAQSQEFNLIFAPHVMLFNRRWVATIAPPAFRQVPPIPDHIRACDHILIDTGSQRSTDMSYTNLADLYCGDVSSQIYEFLMTPRPVLHIDAHQTRWADNPDYAHWYAGPVIQPGVDILDAVRQTFASHDQYLPQQKAMFADTFSVTSQPPSVRAAEAIDQFLNTARQ
jgi:hypothetical protein